LILDDKWDAVPPVCCIIPHDHFQNMWRECLYVQFMLKPDCLSNLKLAIIKHLQGLWHFSLL
jgi:hypothetical protein